VKFGRSKLAPDTYQQLMLAMSARVLPCVLLLAAASAGCVPASPSDGGSSSAGSGGAAAPAGSGGAASGGSSSGGTGGSAATGGSGGETSGSTGSGGAPGSGGGPNPSGGTAGEATGGNVGNDGSVPTAPEAGSTTGDGSATPMATDGGPQPSYAGEVPVYDGPDVGPVVAMQCPDDPTAGYTEYKDSFHIERPYDVPISERFSITNGIYNFWVFPNDKAHSTIANGKNPRTEATYGGTYDKATAGTGKGNAAGIGYFTKGQRIYSADVLIEASAKGSIVMQLHTTATGIGPVYLSGGGIPGGKIDQWFNMKIVFDAATLKSQVYINNCMKGTVSGPRGDGHFYFKNGVYHCGSSGGCRTHYKNVHFYVKQ
jgi:hypothetical protein